ncbi:putative candidate secreted effector protein [Blumeria hordei DH14]|uniref:Putative candidate secreted effector protein n=1 Tax=Blumeria graminis f. sp. hordei (strain DH14) TaxID=546991 RepID=N1JDW1_BLUG1|nr:putative candidate secreted effector protein [Blumeria hordei DH14]
MKLQTITQLIAFLCLSPTFSAAQDYKCGNQKIKSKDIKKGLKNLATPSLTLQKTVIQSLYFGNGQTCYIANIPLSNYNGERGRLPPYYLVVDGDDKFLGVVMYENRIYTQCTPHAPEIIYQYSN